MKYILEAKENVTIQDVNFDKGVKYDAIMVDAWKSDEDTSKDIFGFEVTGGYLRRKIVAITRGEVYKNFNVI